MARGLIGKFIRGAAPVMSQALMEEHKANILAERDRRLAELKSKYKLSGTSSSTLAEMQYLEDIKDPEQRAAKKKEMLELKRGAKKIGGELVSAGGDVVVGADRTARSTATVEGAKTQAKKDVELEMDPSITREKEKQKVLGKAEGEKKVNKPKERAKLESTLRKMDRLIGPEQTDKEGNRKPSTIDKAIADAKGLTSTGFTGALTSAVPGTPAYKLRRNLVTLKANLGFDALQEMRDNSPTGGALGSIAVQEMESLQAVVADLDIGQGDEQLIENLELIKDHYSGYRDAVKASFSERYGESGRESQQSRAEPSGNKKYEGMSIEEKIKFLEQKTKLR